MITILAAHPENPHNAAMLAILSGHWSDMARAAVNRLLGRMEP